MAAGTLWWQSYLRFEGGCIIHSMESQPRSIEQGLLDGLVEARDSAEALIAFCKKWGVPTLCKRHELPTSHDPWCLGEMVTIVEPNGDRHQEGKQAIEPLVEFIRILESTVLVGIDITNSRRVNPLDWARIVEGLRPFGDRPSSEFPSIKADAFSFEFALERLVEVSGLRPKLTLNRATKHWQVDLGASHGSNNLLALAIMEAMLRIANQDEYARCHSCSRYYLPKRRPNHKKRNYCDSCGIQASWRDSQRARRAAVKVEEVSR